MRARRSRRLVTCAMVAFAAATALGSGMVSTPRAGAATSRAVVNIGGSNQVISFGGSVTGLQALRMVANVTTVGFGFGEAVCAINGQGNPATQGECLVGPNGEYWSYWRAAPGANGWQYSSQGASGTTVSDGAVEGWRYGTGGPPPFTSFCAVAGCAPPPTVPPPPSTAQPSTAQPSTAQPSTEAPTVAGSSASAPGASRDGTAAPSGDGRADPGATGEDSQGEEGSASTRAAGAGDRGDERASGTSSRDDGDGGSSPIGVIAAGVVVAGLGAGGVVLRRRRRAPVAPG